MLPELIKKHDVDEVVLAYSDLSHQEVMEKAELVLSCGADFRLIGPKSAMLKSKKPVISVCAVRTGCGKSPTTRAIARILKSHGMRAVIVRHPMPYGNLGKQTTQRFADLKELEKQKTTIEEREEYEPLIEEGFVVYAGVDYEKILRNAEKEADIIIWDGGNNDFPFYKPDLHIVLCDARRPGHEITYYPGMANLMMADVIIINKTKTAKKESMKTILKNIKKYNPKARIMLADMPKTVERKELIKNKNVLVIEDGPTLTHGGLDYGAAFLVARQYKAKKIVDPRPYAVGSIKETFRKYPHLKYVLPAMGYSRKQMKELEKTINRVPCDLVIDGSPTNLGRYLRINKTILNVDYRIRETGKLRFQDILKKFM